MSRRVFSRGRVIGGTASLASVCEFVEFTFIGIFKADDTPKTCRFSTPPPIAQEKEISHKKAQKAQDSFCEFCASLWLISLGGQQSATTVFYVQPGRQNVPVFSNQTARVRDCVGIRDGSRDTNNRHGLRRR